VSVREVIRFFYTTIFPLMVRQRVEVLVKGPYHKVYDDKKFIFIHIPKTAGKSIASLLGVRGARHLMYMQYKEIIGKSIDSYYIFTVVRDPVDRLISAYNYLSDGGNNSAEDRAFRKKWLASCKSFEDFVVNVLGKEEVFGSIFFRPQVDFIWNELEEKPDNINIIYYEKLSEGVASLPDNISPNNKSVPHINKSRACHVKNVSNDVIFLIYEFYKNDYSFFGYEMKGMDGW